LNPRDPRQDQAGTRGSSRQRGSTAAWPSPDGLPARLVQSPSTYASIDPGRSAWTTAPMSGRSIPMPNAVIRS